MDRAQALQFGAGWTQAVRVAPCVQRTCDGTPDAAPHGMAKADTDESWTIPLHVVMWTVILVGLVMAMAVVLMH